MRIRVGTLIGLSVLVLGAGVGLGRLSAPDNPSTRASEAAREDPPGARKAPDASVVHQLAQAFRSAVRTIEPSVVHITSETERVILRRDFWGNRYRDLERGSGLGSGVIVSSDGLIVTNAHVIEDATQIRARLHDGRTLDARVIGRDPSVDIAVLRVDASGLTPARFGDSDALQVGDFVLAVGSPFGFSNTVTSGIVSAKGRTGLSRTDADRFEDFIQTDAAINPGNSGGPLVDIDGRVVGINTAIFSRSGGSNGIGFAIPSAIVRQVVDAIVRDGSVRRGYLGVRMADLRPEAIQELGIGDTGGVGLTFVEPGSPADRAGLREGDIVTRFDDQAVRDSQRLRALIALAGPEHTVEIRLLRDGREMVVRATLGDVAGTLAARVGGVASDRFGLIVETVDRDVLARLGYPPDSGIEGVVVLGVLPDSPGERAGLREGDIIYSIGRTIVVDENDFLDTSRRVDLSQGVRVRLIRNGRRAFTDLRP